MNAIWLLNDSFSIKVEYNEYAPQDTPGASIS